MYTITYDIKDFRHEGDLEELNWRGDWFVDIADAILATPGFEDVKVDYDEDEEDGTFSLRIDGKMTFIADISEDETDDQLIVEDILYDGELDRVFPTVQIWDLLELYDRDAVIEKVPVTKVDLTSKALMAA